MWPYSWNVWRDAKESHPAPGACKSAPWPKPNLIKFKECVFKKKKEKSVLNVWRRAIVSHLHLQGFHYAEAPAGGKGGISQGKRAAGAVSRSKRSHLYCSLRADSKWKRSVWEVFLRATLEERWRIFTATSKGASWTKYGVKTNASNSTRC